MAVLLLFKGVVLVVRLPLNLLGLPIWLLWGGLSACVPAWLLLITHQFKHGAIKLIHDSVGRLAKVFPGSLSEVFWASLNIRCCGWVRH